VLSELLADTSENILYAEHIEGDGAKVYERACAMGVEGTISKQQDTAYHSGRVESWIKVKCAKRGAFPIVASSRSSAPSRAGSPRSMWVAEKGTGCSTPARCGAASPKRRPAICASGSIRSFAKTRLSESVKKPKATWGGPVLEAEVAYSTLAENALLREAVFKGLREDQHLPGAHSNDR
jgi:bifunctional non-homologous end joining protein LigD